MNHVPLSQAVLRGRRQDQYFQNVKLKVIPRLVERGLVNGRTAENGQLEVADDEALRAAMRLGIEEIVYNTQGWSCVAIKAPSMDQAAAAIRSRGGGVLAHEPSVRPLALQKGVGIHAEADRRHVFLLKLRDCDWPVLIQTVHWFQSSDALLATLLAAELSEALKTRAVAMWDDDFSGSTAIVCDHGQRTQTINDEDTAEFYGFFYEQGIAVPECFIASNEGGGPARLHVADPAQVERADYFVLPVPDESQVRVPHALSKLGMMAEALAEGLEDEEAFRSHMSDGLWQKVEALRAAAATGGAAPPSSPVLAARPKRSKPKAKAPKKPKAAAKKRSPAKKRSAPAAKTKRKAQKRGGRKK
jgi:hypothetical protein